MALTPDSFKELKKVTENLSKTNLPAPKKFEALKKAMKSTSRRDVL